MKPMRTRSPRSAVAGALVSLLLLAGAAVAQPAAVSYQGQLEVDGVPFTGDASFKFAVMCGSDSPWSNDGTSTGGGEPAAAVTLPVVQGVFSVLLGDPALAMVPLTADLIHGCTTPALRVWVDTGTGFEQIGDQPLASSPFALEAALARGAIGVFTVSGGALPTIALDGGSGEVRVGSLRFADDSVQTTAAGGGSGGDGWTVVGNDVHAAVGGNVGIGTIAPETKLHLAGPGVAPEIRSGGAGTMLAGEAWGGLSLHHLGTGLLGRAYWKGAAALAPDFTIDARNKADAVTVDGATGVVGMQTPTPSATKTLTLQGIGANSGWLQFRTSAGADAWHLTNEAGGLNFVESGIAANRLVLLPGGNVGLGTATPDARLDVAGNAIISGNLTVQGTIIGGGGGGGGGSIAVPPAALQEAETNQMDVHRSGVFLHGRTAGQGLTLEAPVYLPDGATITGFEVHLTDTDATAALGRNIQTFLMSNPFAAGAGTIIASLSTTGAPGRTVLSVTNLNTVVNNTTRNYTVTCNWTTPTGAVAVTALAVHGMRVIYTMP